MGDFWKRQIEQSDIGAALSGLRRSKPDASAEEALDPKLVQNIVVRAISPLGLSDRKKKKIRPAVMEAAAKIDSMKGIRDYHECGIDFTTAVSSVLEHNEASRLFERIEAEVIDYKKTLESGRDDEIKAGYGLEISDGQVKEAFLAAQSIAEKLPVPEDKTEALNELIQNMVEMKAAQRRIPADAVYQESERAWNNYDSAKREVETFLLESNANKEQQVTQVMREMGKAIDKAFGYERSH